MNSPQRPRLTDKNHYKYGYNRRWFSQRTQAQEEWTVHYENVQAPVLTFRQACLWTARQLAHRAGRRKIWLCLSGGIDSEIVARSFLQQNIPFSCAILEFEQDLNRHDITWAYDFCQTHRVPFTTFSLNIRHFWRTQALSYAHRSQCVTPQLLPLMWLAEHIDGFPVIGNGDQWLEREPIQDLSEVHTWWLWEDEKSMSLYRFFQEAEIVGCPGFYQFTSELLLGYLFDPWVERLTNNELNFTDSSKDFKFQLYQNHFPELSYRSKLTGYEKVAAEDFQLRQNLLQLYPEYDDYTGYEVNALKKYLTGRGPLIRSQKI